MGLQRRATPLLLVVTSIVSVQLGGALAATLVPVLGALPTVALRLGLGAAVLLLGTRPQVRGHDRAGWLAVVAFGVALALMNSTFYACLARLPIGVAVTIEFLGPLALAGALSRRLVDALSVVAALVGVVLVSGAVTAPWAELDHLGIGLALAAGACWAAYILCSRQVGRNFPAVDGLTLAMLVAATLVLPLGLAQADPAALTPGRWGAALGIALLSSVIPYSLELLALRDLDARVFGVLLSLEPAAAATAGLLVLGQRLDRLQISGMALVVAASVVVMSGRSAPEPGAPT
ncbi:EamA family transporter [Arsenicicoccus dermatophilus]|uniref:EamA family transporter n=1 Tax=Arsenicicoccus dermatophilus TaxID=1076331 RepID=UPI001F4D00E8|nr:EamA family transporter [Arsenicicoccus dermatophilus]MCH8613082.1 EamA family transporter [Arsenicicoccus dermatophilus]